jgi:ADP-heptose:LPS heptosyltransferase
MLENALAYIGLQFSKFQFRNDFDHVQPLTDFFRTARNVLVTLPVGYDDAVVASKALRDFRARWDKQHMVVVHTSTRSTSLADFPNCEVVRIDPNDINRFSLPRASLLQRIFKNDFDVAIDLNLDFVLHTAYICKASRAKVRVGFIRPPIADVFFNVQMNITHQRTQQALYDKFAACLAMF